MNLSGMRGHSMLVSMAAMVIVALANQDVKKAATPLPILPIATAQAPWPSSDHCNGAFCGDVRAVLNVTAADIASGEVTVQVFWRRRDPTPVLKKVFVLLASSDGGRTWNKSMPMMPINGENVEGTCGLVTFFATTPGIYHLYYLPFTQTGGGAWTKFHWTGCNSTVDDPSNPCVLGRRRRSSSSTSNGVGENAPRHVAEEAYDPLAARPHHKLRHPYHNKQHENGAATAAAAAAAAITSSASTSVCNTELPHFSSMVVGLETRDSFNAFTDMEMMAGELEVADAQSALRAAPGHPFIGVFPEPFSRSIRVFDSIPARWIPAYQPPTASAYTGSPTFTDTTAPGTWLPLQLGLWAYETGVDIKNIAATVDGSGLTCTSPGGAPVIPASQVYFVNLGGVDIKGNAFQKAYSINASRVGALWLGVQIPADAPEGCVYTGSISLTSPSVPSSSPVTVSLNLHIQGQAVPLNGTTDPTQMSRLSWLYSTRGLESDEVPAPFVPLTYSGGAAAQPLVIHALLKTVTINPNGLLGGVEVVSTQTRRGLPVQVPFSVLSKNGGMVLSLLDAQQPGVVLPSVVVTPAHVVSSSDAQVTWVAQSAVTLSSPAGCQVQVTITGTMDFSSFVSYNATLASPTCAASLGDVQLVYTMNATTAKALVGMETAGTWYHDLKWRWTSTTASNKVWVGRIEAGLLLSLRGEGDAWESPMFSKDFPVIPFVPNTWGGVDALPANNPNGVNIVNGTVVAFSGARTVAQGAAVSFLFDLVLTPSKAINWTRHWATRAVQVGYGTDYMSPETVKGLGATVVTLHQGTPGIVNGSMVNPWINYPFLNDTVPLLTNYTRIANGLGMATKFYYTVRELSTHAPEAFAFAAQQGELFLDQNPYIIVQPGYAHDWDAHGGSAYLHQHFVTHYAACWQQQVATGDWDPSVCDYGISRLFNYYVEGLWWSMSQPPYINGVYYDGINFPRLSMLRIRRTADKASAQQSAGFPPLLDLHTGRDPTPPICSYAGHYPFVDYIWNGEGFDFSGSAAYWMVEISNQLHGLTGDMLGSGPGSIFKGMLFGMTERNSAAASFLWKFWDNVDIQSTAMMGWWLSGAPLVNITHDCAADPAAVLATVYTKYTSHAVVALASFCAKPVTVTLQYNWAELGLSAAAVSVDVPNVPNVQYPFSPQSPEGPFDLVANGGALITITPK